MSELNWYTIDENYKYVLVGISNGHTILVDILQSIIIMKFEKFGTLTTNLIWLKNEPGTFISFSKGLGRAAFWNVSKKNYNEIVKFTDGSVIGCVVMPDPNKLLISVDNGSVIIYDLKFRKTVFELPPAHSETIFDLKYNPLNYGIFATGSYDSCIKIWDINKNKIISNLRVDHIASIQEKKKLEEPERVTIYSLKWSVNDKNLLASGDSKGHVRIWDISKNKMQTNIKLSSALEPHIIGIDWENGNNILASCLDSVYILKYENQKLSIYKTFKVGNNTFQVKFNPYDTSSFAVGCQDNTIKIYTDVNDKPLKTLTGHTKKVFGLAYNSRKKNILASTSDDFRVGIWDLEGSTNYFLTGHTNNTRQALWLPDFPQILITGSWDGTIRVWNTEMVSCISVINEHYSDVYGLDISPHHPMLLTSSSRDNSVRFWNLAFQPGNYIKLIMEIENLSKLDFGNLKILEVQVKMSQSSDLISSADIISNYFFVFINLINYISSMIN